MTVALHCLQAGVYNTHINSVDSFQVLTYSSVFEVLCLPMSVAKLCADVTDSFTPVAGTVGWPLNTHDSLSPQK